MTATTRNGETFKTAQGVKTAIRWCLNRARQQRAWATGRPTARAHAELNEAEAILDGQGLLTGADYVEQMGKIARTRESLGLV